MADSIGSAHESGYEPDRTGVELERHDPEPGVYHQQPQHAGSNQRPNSRADFQPRGKHRQPRAGPEEALAVARRVSEDERSDECGAGEGSFNSTLRVVGLILACLLAIPRGVFGPATALGAELRTSEPVSRCAERPGVKARLPAVRSDTRDSRVKSYLEDCYRNSKNDGNKLRANHSSSLTVSDPASHDE